MTLVSEEHDSKSPVKLSPTQKVLQKILQKRVDFNVFFLILSFWQKYVKAFQCQMHGLKGEQVQ
jgi:hypothetical protein